MATKNQIRIANHMLNYPVNHYITRKDLGKELNLNLQIIYRFINHKKIHLEGVLLFEKDKYGNIIGRTKYRTHFDIFYIGNQIIFRRKEVSRWKMI